jgi:copper chaperone CopZ
MIGKLRFATVPQIVVMTIAWLAICLAIDYHFNPQLWAKNGEPPPASAQLSLHVHHLRCKGCLEDIKAALGTLPALQNAPMTVRVTGPDSAPGDFAGWLDITVPDVQQIDFVALDQALRQAGFVPSQVEFGGLRHFRFEGRARHLCGPESKGDCEPLPDVGKVRRGDRLKWLDSLSLDATGSTVVFHVRYQLPTDRIDVRELFTAMDDFVAPRRHKPRIATPPRSRTSSGGQEGVFENHIAPGLLTFCSPSRAAERVTAVRGSAWVRRTAPRVACRICLSRRCADHPDPDRQGRESTSPGTRGSSGTDR